MLQIVVTGSNILLGRLNGVVLEDACGVMILPEGWALKPLIGADKRKFSNVYLQHIQFLNYDVTDDEMKSVYVKLTTGLVLKQ